MSPTVTSVDQIDLDISIAFIALGVARTACERCPSGENEHAVDAAQSDWIVVIDEAYHQFSGGDHRSLVRERGNRISLRTFSKAWGLAGLRLGYALTSVELATNLQKLVSAFNVIMPRGYV